MAVAARKGLISLVVRNAESMYHPLVNKRRFSTVHPQSSSKPTLYIPTDSALAVFIKLVDKKDKETVTSLVALAERILASEKQTQEGLLTIIKMSNERQAEANTQILRLTSRLAPRAAFEFYEELRMVSSKGRNRKERWSNYLENNPQVAKQLKRNLEDLDLPTLASECYRLLSEK
ncbi:hypothetical protein PTTG_27569 [Puccinia triticina 1-1 BBBD Race 1]|uniref:Uncharacterized protein n=2 Tax=Puccinia triticina TaxID=208348 RepID=A0A180GIY6_PUCT1|nr:uncharacterized protein PtA15_2A868 [Puccinia triticina]OAV92615.1 hypothetical protein PTTG_27569 [Puccinia triticina 1-1 BBBD Race 1]WAQ82551.1 hypothetical protein PtA15_2A868 [Puccinia triticina]WAR53403.1 hypothetical protein PtB15_2B834 [Puccinia triticina]